ncbi:hypothetical protein FOQG_06393 [Fusarium oxysporum f. sp. raphani 54005]|uniref:Uncharacterized protein n=4 Tax=Fusarium oxysporum TaxID=5507 RepID=X0CLM9_FUSOX|nr:hypothetical protein FOVG_08422 [Fusarium oxysporum f. sp. pisi HDV247]EXK91714.1 hypothetical protein FOQG_06393 [Fusarium oxysporum f. sp. raphani 54005]EXL84141.1 hypothetical protein FOPG_03257 [Fusarium oxysporum f. sp. conglutinans race 2 54008]EXM22244.1 hypothetical protein FOTG_09916 [Fusarium oxysporum f. sp. vasinfectum 25433]
MSNGPGSGMWMCMWIHEDSTTSKKTPQTHIQGQGLIAVRRSGPKLGLTQKRPNKQGMAAVCRLGIPLRTVRSTRYVNG